MTFKNQKRIVNSESSRLIVGWVLAIILVCLFSYGYLVRAAIVNIVDRQSMEKDISTLGSTVLSLESEYVKVKNSITLESAQSLGFVPVTSQKFVTKSPPAGLSVR